jgi:hypothetical protein
LIVVPPTPVIGLFLIGLGAAYGIHEIVGVKHSAAVPQIASTDRAEICRYGYARQKRAEFSAEQWAAKKREAVIASGLDSGRSFEFDHIVPLCLGGSNSSTNLQLQPWPEAHVKDRLEVYACKAVCRGDIQLDRVQAMFLNGSWKASYRQVFHEDPLTRHTGDLR